MKKIERKTVTLDATGKVVGRLSSDIAKMLQGKHRADYVPNLDCGDIIVVEHASKLKLDPVRSAERFHITHSGYPGGLKKKSVQVISKTDPGALITHAVYSMLPQNKLRPLRMKRLTVNA